MIKMIDVANHAGVSIKTVSRVVNNEPTVQAEYKEKVLKSIELLGYVPSTSARTLRSNRSYQVNFITDSSRNLFSNRVLFGAMQACHDMGYQLVLDLIERHKQDDPDHIDKWIEKLLLKTKPEGILALPPLSLNRRFVDKLIEAKIPVVNIGGISVNDKQGAVTINDKLAAEEMTTYLIKKGHRRIGFVKGDPNQSSAGERFRGYKLALSKNDIPFDEALAYQGDFNLESGLAAGSKMLSKESRPTAIFASNDEMAAGVMVAAHNLGIDVPNQLSVAGFDDNFFITSLWPGLTTIRQPLEGFGRTAIEILISIRGNPDNVNSGEQKCLGYELIERDSVADLNPGVAGEK